MSLVLPPVSSIMQQVRAALLEDVGDGDLTAALLPDHQRSEVILICRENACLCGRHWVAEVFRQLNADVQFQWQFQDGDLIPAGAQLAIFNGPTRALLTGERTALNFLQTLSATATVTRRYVDAVAGTGVRILDTRKTIPGLRLAQKYAVRCGGGANHRLGLFDALLIKENHIQAAGSIAAALTVARQQFPGVPTEIEVETLEQLHQALDAAAQHILLDNFDLNMLRTAVIATAGRARLEASGGVDLITLRALAETGVNDISVGALTKHLHAVDLSLRFVG